MHSNARKLLVSSLLVMTIILAISFTYSSYQASACVTTPTTSNSHSVSTANSKGPGLLIPGTLTKSVTTTTDSS